MHLNIAWMLPANFLRRETQQEHQGSSHREQSVDVNIRESLSLRVQRIVHFGEGGPAARNANQNRHGTGALLALEWLH
jgi:hypothetical protein